MNQKPFTVSSIILVCILLFQCGKNFSVGDYSIRGFSFERNGLPDKRGWEGAGVCVQDAPPEGGEWCLFVPGGGCATPFPNAYTTIKNIRNGESWELSFWAKGTGTYVEWKTDKQSYKTDIESDEWQFYSAIYKVFSKKNELKIIVHPVSGFISHSIYIDLIDLRRIK